MRDFNHIKDRLEREIDEIMYEKKWTPKHAEALEELLMGLKCLEEMENGGGKEHLKKKMKKMKHKMPHSYNMDEEEDDDDDEEEEWKKMKKKAHKYGREWEPDDYAMAPRMRRNGGMRQNYNYMPTQYHYLPFPHDDADYMDDMDWGYGDYYMPPFRYERGGRGGRGQNQYNQYTYPRNQYEQGTNSNGSSNNGSGQSGNSANATGTTTPS